MKKICNCSTLLLSGIVLTASAMTSRAVMETETVMFGASPFPEMLTLPEFNSTLGQLTGVSITVTTTTTLQSSVVNLGPATSFTDATATGTTSLSGLLGLTYSQMLSTTPMSGTIANGTGTPVIQTVASASSTTPQTFLIPSADFGSYESGVPANILFDADFKATYLGSATPGTAPEVFFGGTASVSGMVDVTYTYAVPESATIWAGVAAVGCLAFHSRSRLRFLRP